MPIFRLTESLVFPSPHYAEPDGLLAIGGDLSPQRLLEAYALGIFPWYSDYTPILWWSPHPRLVLFPDEFRVSASLRRVVKRKTFTVTVDRCFREVMRECARVPRSYGEGTWITEEMLEAYCRLHRLGYAHSVESWQAGELVGGLYGVALGRAFFGESMFMRKTDASKVALVYLVNLLRRFGFEFVDCQVTTAHLQRFGAREVAREDFLGILSEAVAKAGLPGSWASMPLEE